MQLSFTNIARNAYESAHPELWKSLAIALFPILGRQGTTVYNLAGRTNGVFDGTPSVWDTILGKTAVQFDSTNNGCIAVPHHDDYSTLPSGTTAEPGALSWVWLVRRPAGQDIGWSKYENHYPFLGEWHVDTSSGYATAHTMRWQILGSGAIVRIGITTTEAVPADEWTVIAGRYPGGITGNDGADSMEFFFNGIRQGQSRTYNDSFTTHTNRGGLISIGTGIYTGTQHLRTGDQFGGLLVFPRRYLSVAEIQELSNDILLPLRRRVVQPYWVLGDVPGGVFKPFNSPAFTSRFIRSSRFG